MEIVEREFGKANLSLETGRLARQANGSVLVRYGDTMVLVAATAAPGSGAGADFFPLSVFYVEKAYAAGRIPGGFFKREARLSDSETLISRIIDRPLRPSFHENYLAETRLGHPFASTHRGNPGRDDRWRIHYQSKSRRDHQQSNEYLHGRLSGCNPDGRR